MLGVAASVEVGGVLTHKVGLASIDAGARKVTVILRALPIATRTFVVFILVLKLIIMFVNQTFFRNLSYKKNETRTLYVASTRSN